MKSQPQLREIDDGIGDGLEYLECCPACGDARRELLHEGLKDRLFGTSGEWTMYRCLRCESGYLNPRPGRTEIISIYDNYYTHAEAPSCMPVLSDKGCYMRKAIRNDYMNWRYGYVEEPAFSLGRWIMWFLPPYLRNEWDYKARNLPRANSKRNQLLDLGCGNGDFLKLAEGADWQAVGLDFDIQALGIAEGRDVRVVAGTAESLPFGDESFNVVTLSHVLEHIHDPFGVISEVWRVLKPGGLVWLSTPNIHSLIHRRYGRFWYSLQSPYHLVLFSENGIRELLQCANFEAISLHRRGWHVRNRMAFSNALKSGQSGHRKILGSQGGSNAFLPHVIEAFLSVFPSLQDDLVMSAVKRI